MLPGRSPQEPEAQRLSAAWVGGCSHGGLIFFHINGLIWFHDIYILSCIIYNDLIMFKHFSWIYD